MQLHLQVLYSDFQQQTGLVLPRWEYGKHCHRAFEYSALQTRESHASILGSQLSTHHNLNRRSTNFSQPSYNNQFSLNCEWYHKIIYIFASTVVLWKKRMLIKFCSESTLYQCSNNNRRSNCETIIVKGNLLWKKMRWSWEPTSMSNCLKIPSCFHYWKLQPVQSEELFQQLLIQLFVNSKVQNDLYFCEVDKLEIQREQKLRWKQPKVSFERSYQDLLIF